MELSPHPDDRVARRPDGPTAVQTAAYGFAIVPVAALSLPLSAFLPPLYGDALGVGVGLVGAIFLAARLWDFITDLAMGWMIDRFPSRWGRRRHWVALALPILMLASWRLYFPPDAPSAAYLGIWLFVLYVGLTLLLITHYAWGAELSATDRHRARLYGWRDAFLVMGILAALLGPAIAEQASGANLRQQVNVIGVWLLCTLPLGIAGLLLVLPDNAPRRPPEQALSRGLSAVRREPAVRAALWLEWLTGMAQSLSGAVFIFAAVYAYGLGGRAALLLLAYFAAGLVALPLWILAAQRFGPERTLFVCLAWSVVMGLAYWIIPAGRFDLLAALVIANGFALGPPFFITKILMARAIDATTPAGETPIYAFGFAMMGMVNKLASAMAVGASALALTLVGFQGREGPVTDIARLALRGMLAVGPALMCLLGLLVLAGLVRRLQTKTA